MVRKSTGAASISLLRLGRRPSVDPVLDEAVDDGRPDNPHFANHSNVGGVSSSPSNSGPVVVRAAAAFRALAICLGCTASTSSCIAARVWTNHTANAKPQLNAPPARRKLLSFTRISRGCNPPSLHRSVSVARVGTLGGLPPHLRITPSKLKNFITHRHLALSTGPSGNQLSLRV